MSSSKDLCTLSISELADFFNSFDNVICDCDGVIFIVYKLIEGVKESISSLKKLGKKIVYVTNNNGVTREEMSMRMSKQGINTVADDILNPVRAIVDYLKEIKFDKKVFLISLPGLRKELENAGFEIVNSQKPDVYPDLVENGIRQSMLQYDKDVGAVIVCMDVNMTYSSLNKAYRYISKIPDAIFIVSGYDKKILIAPNELCLGPSYFHDVLEEATQKTPIKLGKPSKEFGNYICSTLKYDPKKTLFIGDSLENDVAFANGLGYQSLLVLTGTSSLDDLEACSEDQRPNFYVNSLGSLRELIEKFNA